MSRIDSVALAAGLERLREGGVIQSWQTRPLGMYWLILPNGQDLRPSAKETAMWVMGALHSAEVVSIAMGAALRVDRDAIDGGLEQLQESGHLESWSHDADGDYETELPDGSRQNWYARDMPAWLTGMGLGLASNLGLQNQEDAVSLEAQLLETKEQLIASRADAEEKGKSLESAWGQTERYEEHYTSYNDMAYALQKAVDDLESAALEVEELVGQSSETRAELTRTQAALEQERSRVEQVTADLYAARNGLPLIVGDASHEVPVDRMVVMLMQEMSRSRLVDILVAMGARPTASSISRNKTVVGCAKAHGLSIVVDKSMSDADMLTDGTVSPAGKRELASVYKDVRERLTRIIEDNGISVDQLAQYELVVLEGASNPSS